MQNLTYEELFNEVKTLYEIFMRGVRISGSKPCCCWRTGPEQPYTWISYNEVLQRAKSFGSGLIYAGAIANPSQFIGVLCENIIEIVVIEQACNCYSMVTVPIPDISAESNASIISKYELKIIIVEKIQDAVKILNYGLDIQSSLDVIVVMENLTDEIISLGKIYNVQTYTFLSLEQIGNANLKDVVPPKPDDMRAIAFTSGTTGIPKGVMLTHKNVVSSICGGICILKQSVTISANNNDELMYLSYFPPLSVVELVSKSIFFCFGGKVGLYAGDRTKVLEIAQALKPTIIPVPPTLVSHVYKLVMSKVNQSLIKSVLFKTAMKAKTKLLTQGVITTDTFWDRFVFNKIINMFGGNVRVFLLIGGSIPDDELKFLKCAVGAKPIYSYGISETTGAVTLASPFDLSPGSVGPPIPCCQVKLVDAHEQQYLVENGFGEICVKGPSIFSGYYKDELLTKTVIDEDGWFHTGDIGTWLSNGCLSIIARRKNIFMLSTGKRITPERIETVLLQNDIVDQVFVYGNNDNSFVVAIVVPLQRHFQMWSSEKGFKGSQKSLCENPNVADMILEEFAKFGCANGLNPFEIPKRISLSDEHFSPENGLLTMSRKMKRNEIYLKFKSNIESMFV